MEKSDNSDLLAESDGISINTLPGLAAKGLWRGQTAHASTAHRFYWITRGQGRISILGPTRGYAAQMLVFVPAGTVAALPLLASMQGYMLSVPDSLPVPVPAFPAMIRAMRVADQGQITAFFDQIAQEARLPQSGSDHVIESQVTMLSVWIERRQDRNEFYGPADRAGRLAEAFLQRLEQGFRHSHTVADYAAGLDVTPTHLSRVCREVLGKPAFALIAGRLVFEARRRLADSTAPIGTIATALGYGNAAHFSRFFTQQTGQSPRAFRLSRDEPAQRRPARPFNGAPRR